MAEYILSCSSTADMPESFFTERQIPYVCFHYTIDGETYPDDLGKTMDFDTFYSRLSSGSTSVTTQVNVSQYEALWEPYLIEGKDVIHVTLSSCISGTYNSACAAAESLREKYPDRKLYVIDSLCASGGYGLLMTVLADRRDSGASIDELHEYGEDMKMHIQHWIFSSDLTHYLRGGRISKLAFAAGKILNICPLINMDVDGKLAILEKPRTKKKAIDRTVEIMGENLADVTSYDGYCYISSSACQDIADQLQTAIEERFPFMTGRIKHFSIGTVIGSHTGPGTVAVFFVGKRRG